MSLSLVIMAAGMGSRYGGNKQTDGFGPNGETLLEYAIYDAIRAGFKECIIITRKELANYLEDDLFQKLEGKIDCKMVFQELECYVPEGVEIPKERVKPWGTAHAVLCAKEACRGDFAVINADDFYGPHAYQLLAKTLPSVVENQSLLVAYTLEQTLSPSGAVSRGVCTTQGHELVGIEEFSGIERGDNGLWGLDSRGAERKLSGDEAVSMNLWGFSKAFFTSLERDFKKFARERGQEATAECYLPAVVNAELEGGKHHTSILRCDEYWYGVTYQEDKAWVREAIAEKIAEGTYPEKLWS